MRKIKWEFWQDATELESEIPTTEEDMEIVTFMVRTPIGIFSPNDPFLPSRMCECWVGHTNFDIDMDFIRFLDEIEGVEIVAPISRYRFFIGVGKMFSFSDVRAKIQLGIGMWPQSLEEAFSDEYEKIKEKTQWAIFISDSGEITTISSDYAEDKEYQSEFNRLNALENGILISNE
jgi:hypothetical protein